MTATGLSNKYKTLLNKKKVNTPIRLAHFFAQIKHESNMKPVSEDLRYSPKTLNSVFKKYFPTVALANEYAYKPEKIANKVYANRMGNGSTESGEAWKYIGRGFIQITGKDNYKRLTKATGVNYLDNPTLLLNEADSMISALWYWEEIGGNALADKDDLDSISDLINIGKKTKVYGDSNGFKDRKDCLIEMKKEFKV